VKQELHQEPAADLGMLEIQGRLRQLEQRDLWLWGAAIVVMLLLILAVVSFSLPALAQEESPFSVHHLDQAVQGLLGLVLLFSIHVIYQLILVRRLRRQLARQLEIIARQELRTEQLRQLVLTDPLTGLYNRRFLEQHLVVEIARSRRQDYLLSVLMLDLNDFKQINDCYGHSAGDLVLTHFAIHIRKAIRSSDIPIRMGGDEFLVLLPECRPEQVLSVLSRLHGLEVEHHGRKIPFAFSAGWAACQPDDGPKQILERVDQALLTDKLTGKTQQELNRLEAQIRQAEKMEAVGRLAGGVAHDFNNLLMVIRGYTELLLSRADQSDSLSASAKEIQKAADRATALTQQLLALSRKQVVQPQVLDLNAVVADMDKLLRRVIREDIERVTLLKPGLGRVKADQGQIEQIIMNLAVNARDAMPKGGKLIVETSNVELDEGYVSSHPVVTPGSYVMLAVSDSGAGIDQETQTRIFEPFFTTKENGKGTGLGLATVYGIVKQSGGYIWVYSEPGQGTTFKIYLPRIEETDEKAKLEEAIAPPARGSETVLVVEDEMSVRRLTRQFLEENGYRVLEAIEGCEALRISNQHKGPIHLLLTDVVMPQMSGRELAHSLVPLRPEMKVLYMSGYTDDAIVHHGLLEQDIAFLQKPFTLDALAHKVRAVLDARNGK